LNLTTTTAQIRIAIVEDDVATRKMLATAVVAESEFTVIAEFGEAKAAIASLSSVMPDVLLVDLGLPDLSGIEVIRAAATRLPQCDILVITTLGDEPTIIAALKAGADGYILKGTDISELRQSIRAMRDGGSPLSPIIARSLLNTFNSTVAEQSDLADASAQLTKREITILQTIARGHSYVETSIICGISAGTVHSHLKSIYRKFAVSSKTQAIHEARIRKIIS
jgi:DNA-binding NarL/FixJ family response regulator